MKEIELKVPNLGEAEDTEIIEISVKKGDKLNKNDPIIVLESEKAAMEVPSDFDGIVKDIMVKEGDSVKEGVVFAVIEVEEMKEIQPKEDKAIPSSQKHGSAEDEQPLNKTDIIDFSGINAGPAVRKIARELEIDLNHISGTGRNSMITKDDLKRYIHSKVDRTSQKLPSISDFEAFGTYEIKKQSKIQQLGAANLLNSWQQVPHVTHFEEIDVTSIEKYRKTLNQTTATKVTPLAYLIRYLSETLMENEIFNSSLLKNGELIIKKYVNIGIAIDTPEGLVVPNIKDANSLNEIEIAEALINLSTKAKNKKLLTNDFNGTTFTISSLGSIGGTGFTPIINPPEVGIIGVSRAKYSPSLVDGKLIEKMILPVSLSYDHRVINGADAGKFMLSFKEKIENSDNKITK